MLKWFNKLRLKGLPTKTDTNVLVVDDNGDIGINTSSAGDITSVVAGAGLTGGATSGDATVNIGAGNLIDVQADQVDVDLSELTDGTADVVGSADELVYLDAGAQKRKQIDEIKLGQFNNDQSWTSNSGDITAITITTDDSEVVTASSGDADFVIEGGEGIDTSSADSTVTITGELASSANKGVASFSEDDFVVSSGAVTLVDLTAGHLAAGTLVIESETIASNDNDTTLPTSAAVKDHVDAKYSYQYITFLADSDAIVDNQYIVPGTSGISNHSWNKDSDLDYTGANATTIGHADAHITMDYLIGIASVPIPHTCDLCGFYAVGRNEVTNGNNFGIGMFVSEVADVDWGGTGNWDANLRAFSLSEGTGNEKRIQRIDGILGTPFTVHEGDIITPAVVAPTGDQVKATITLVLRTKLTT